MEERDKLILEIMALSYAVDQRTDYCVFCNFSGHVQMLSVSVRESRDRWQNEIASTEFYLNGKFEPDDDLKWLKSKRDHLRHILDTNEVDTDAMEQVVVKSVEYAF